MQGSLCNLTADFANLCLRNSSQVSINYRCDQILNDKQLLFNRNILHIMHKRQMRFT